MDRLPALAAALAHLHAGRWQEAEASVRPILAERPDDPDALLVLGLAVAGGGEAERAAPAVIRLAQLRPQNEHPCLTLTRILDRRAGLRGTPSDRACRDDIGRLFQARLRLAANDAGLRLDYAGWLLEHAAAGRAIDVLRDAPESPRSLHLIGTAQAEAGAFEAAARSFRRLTRLAPMAAAGWSNLGMMLKVLGRHDAALAAHDEAVRRAPEDPHLRMNRAVTLLHAGRWQEAWPDYDARLRMPDRRGLPLSALLPDLHRLEDLRGVTVLATHEDGFGDTLHFMRYLPMLADRGARVLAWVPQALIRVVGRLPGVTAIAAGGPVPHHDFHCPMFSLPRAFVSTPATVPAAPYVSPDPALVARWAQRVPHHGFRIGVVWRGQARPWLPGFTALDGRRSMRLRDFAPLAAIPGVTLVSLQEGASEGRPRLHDPMAEVRDFADTAAIIAQLDLVVSVDTAVVHLAGAMGRPVFMLDRYDNCWRWLHGRADSPWYPSLTIFRQDRPGDWSGPMRRLVAAVQGLVAFNGAAAAVPRPSLAPALADAA